MILQFISKDLSNPYQRPISGDAMAYYAYLPALFIYQDLDYEFTKEINEKYYPPAYAKSFVKETPEGEKVNKTFPGAAVLYAPFFSVAHVIALTFGLEADGYSSIYQFFYLLGFWTYFLLGLILFVKVLVKMGFAEKLVNMAVLILVLGTNIFFYSVHDQSVTHIYNFFMINACIYCLLLFRDGQRFKYLGMGIFLLALIGITRPTNVLVLPLILFFLPTADFYKALLLKLKQGKHLIKILLIGAAVLLIPLLLWKAQTGKWIVYSYGEEGFNFADPHMREFTFSYLKGWITYSPIVLLILAPGLILLFQKKKGQAIYVLGFYLLCIYVFSSWWCWYYGAGMGQRVMIDHLILMGYLLLLVLSAVQERKLLRIGLTSIFVLLIGLNIAQSYQIRYGILPLGAPTEEQYWDNFLSFEKTAKVYPRDNWHFQADYVLDLDPEKRQGPSNNSTLLIDDQWTIHVSDYFEFSSGGEVDSIDIMSGDKMIFQFEARAITPVEETKVEAYLVYVGGENTMSKDLKLAEHLKLNQWVEIDVLIESRSYFNRAGIRFWNVGTSEKVEFRNIRLLQYHSEDYL